MPARTPTATQCRNRPPTRGAKSVIDAASLQSHPGWRVGLTGAPAD